MTDLLIQTPLLTLFVIIAIGYILGRIKIGNFSLGVAGALFAGIAISAWEPRLALPSFVHTLGLVMFVYTTGLALGPTFFSTMKKSGLRDNMFTFGIIAFGAIVSFIAAKYFAISTGMAAGMYTGIFTVTPALAGVLEAMPSGHAEAIIGYSIAYPFSVIVSLLLLGFFRKIWKIDAKEASETTVSIDRYTVRYTREEPCAVRDVPMLASANIAISRLSKRGKLRVAKSTDIIEKDSLVTIVGTQGESKKAAAWMGEAAPDARSELENTSFGYRRVFISNNSLAGLTISELELDRKFNVIITRLRRGDVDMVAHDDLAVEPGDRLRIVGKQDDVRKASNYLGDSYRLASEMNVFTFAFGMALGIAVGFIPVPLPNGSVFQLGAAGGTIVVGLILGAMRRTGNLVWQIPYSTNLAIRQFGLVMFLAGVGSQAGGSLMDALSNQQSYIVMALAMGVSLLVTGAMIVLGYRIMRIPYTKLSGMVAAMNTQPATLAFANDQTKTDQANIGYATVYPLSLIGKVVLAQLLLIALTI